MHYNEVIYLRLVDGLRLAASTFEVQCEVLPDFVHVPDEVLNAVDYIYIPQLLKAGFLTTEQATAFREYEDYLDTTEIFDSYKAALEDLESGEWFEELRRKALSLLHLLGEEYKKPTLEGTTFVKGR